MDSLIYDRYSREQHRPRGESRHQQGYNIAIRHRRRPSIPAPTGLPNVGLLRHRRKSGGKPAQRSALLGDFLVHPAFARQFDDEMAAAPVGGEQHFLDLSREQVDPPPPGTRPQKR
jgi:hypothetical protein